MENARSSQSFDARAEFLKSLPRKRMSAAGLVFNAEGQVLLVKPSYNEVWHLPGGCVERLESPLCGASREIAEETGLRLDPLRLLCVDYKPGTTEHEEALLFIFDYGQIDEQTIADIEIDGHEIVGFGFFDIETAKTMVTESMKIRIDSAMRARMSHTTYYLEEGTLPTRLVGEGRGS